MRAAALVALLAFGCALEDEPGPAPGTCEAGRSAECPCDDGTVATQTCKADGTGWNACACEADQTPPGGCAEDAECAAPGFPLCVEEQCVAGTRVPGGGDCGAPGALCAEDFDCLEITAGVKRCIKAD